MVWTNHVSAISPLMSALSTPTQSQRKPTQMTKARKARNGSLAMSKDRCINLVPKDMGNGSTQPSRAKLALKKRQKTGSTPLAKTKTAKNSWKKLDPQDRGKGSTHLAKIVKTVNELPLRRCNLTNGALWICSFSPPYWQCTYQDFSNKRCNSPSEHAIYAKRYKCIASEI